MRISMITSGLLLFCFIISCSEATNKKDCKRFKKGRFIYKKNTPDSTHVIERFDNFQIETDRTRSFLRRDSIAWINDCEYELFFITREPLYPPEVTEERKPFLDEMRTKPLHVSILKTGNNFCVFESRINGIDKVYTDTLWVDSSGTVISIGEIYQQENNQEPL